MGNTHTSRHMETRNAMPHRRGSIFWNFRYPYLKRHEHATVMVYNPMMSVTEWLDLLELQQYEGNLQMFNRVDDLADLDDKALKNCGIKNAIHRTNMLNSLLGVQAKRRQSMNLEVTHSTTHTMSRRKNSCPVAYPKPIIEICNASGNSSKDNDNNESPIIYEPLKPSAHSLPISSLSEISEHQKFDMETSSSSLASTPNGVQAKVVGGLAAPSTPALVLTSNITSEQQEAIALKKALEWELSLDSRELRSHAWYHGPLPRQRAEEIVEREGDFLVRDCTSQPDNYVLTCRTKASVLHFVINKILLQPETVYERVQYQFEEDAFDAVPDLITFYVGSGKSISAASGALIQYPCNRTYPLSFYGHKIVGNQLHMQMLAGIRGASPLNSPIGNTGSIGAGNGHGSASIFRYGQPQPPLPQLPQQQQAQQQLPIPQNQSPLSSPPRIRRDVPPPRLPTKKQQRSQSLTPAQAMVVSNIKNGTENGSTPHLDNPNGMFRESRRFSNFEKSSLIALPSESLLEQHLAQLKIHGNGFQTIARCTTSSDMVVDHIKFTTHSLPRPTSAAQALRSQTAARISSLARNFSLESSSLECKQILELPEKPPSPPPKPGRQMFAQPPTLPRKEKDLIPLDQQQQYAMHRAGAVLAYQASGSDSGNGSGDSVQSSALGDGVDFSFQRGVIIKNPRFMSSSVSNSTLKSFTEFDALAAEELLFTLEIPEFKFSSKFDFENFSTLLLPSLENKPLDGDALNTFKMMLLETGPKLISEHITRIDIALIIDENHYDEDQNNEEDTLNCLDLCGLELLTLPQGKIFRDDLIERTQCIKLMVAVTILTCQTDLDRAELLSKWIQIAVETKTALGNLFGFCAIMLGLCMQQVQKLDQAWHILRQKYTDSAFTFEAKLRPTLTSMNECSNPQAPNTTVPHVLLFALLIDRPVLDIIKTADRQNPSMTQNLQNAADIEDRPSLYTTCMDPWELKVVDFGMNINFQHLESSRGFLKNLNLYRKNAKIINEDARSRLDELLSDAFRTEFHVKFLWGSSGASAKPEDRHSKLEKVLTLMADKFCSVNNTNTA